MSIFDIFTFKKEAQQVFSKENISISTILDVARRAIIEQSTNNLLGEEKKLRVDAQVIHVLQQKSKNCKNKLVLLIVNLTIKNVPSITQKVYDLLKEQIENL